MNDPGSRPSSVAPDPDLLVLGLGNDLLGDDGIGPRLIRELRRRPAFPFPCLLRETCGAGLALLDELAGFTQAILLDAILTRRAAPGHVHEIPAEGLPRLTIGSPHFLGVGETLALGRALGLPMPHSVTVLAIEVEDPYTIAERLGTRLEVQVPSLVRRVIETIHRVAGRRVVPSCPTP